MAISVPIILFAGGMGISFVGYLLQLVHMVHEEQQRHLHTVSSSFLALSTLPIFIDEAACSTPAEARFCTISSSVLLACASTRSHRPP